MYRDPPIHVPIPIRMSILIPIPIPIRMSIRMSMLHLCAGTLDSGPAGGAGWLLYLGGMALVLIGLGLIAGSATGPAIEVRSRPVHAYAPRHVHEVFCVATSGRVACFLFGVAGGAG